MMCGKALSRPAALGLLLVAAFSTVAAAADHPQWGEAWSRNMVSDETGLPESFDPQTGRNVKWSVPLGTQSYATPVVAGGKVLVGTNNGNPRDPRHQGDRGVLLCLNEADGSLAWQLVVPKLEDDRYLDWPESGICSPPTVEGDRVYAITNRAEVVSLALGGLAHGNQGPYRDEARHMTPRDQPPLTLGPTDADILWLFDMASGAGIHPHDQAHSSVLIDGAYLYLNTGNGVDNTHRRIRCPEAPSLIVLDKATGRLLGQDGERIGPRIFHSTWSPPALGDVDGRRLIFFCGGDGVCYAFDALRPGARPDGPQTLRRVWRCDLDPAAPKEDIHRYLTNRHESPSNVKSTPVFWHNRIYVTYGGDIWWGKNRAWLKCIDAAQTGDLTQRGLRWSYDLVRHCCSTPSIRDGLVYVADCGGKVHCVDAETGEPCWVHDAGGEIWASTLVADGKVYVGTRRGDFWVLAAGRQKRILGHVHLDQPLIGSPVAANGTLYVSTLTRLYAVRGR